VNNVRQLFSGSAVCEIAADFSSKGINLKIDMVTAGLTFQGKTAGGKDTVLESPVALGFLQRRAN
jgi:hypothetical protein